MSKLSTLGPGSGLFRRGTEAIEQATAEMAPAAPAAPAARPNRYGGKCRHCGGYIKGGEGLLGPRVGGQWTVEHDGECPLSLDEAPTKVEPEPEAPAIQVRQHLPEGSYTAVFEDGSHLAIKVVVQEPWDDFMPGATVLRYYDGPGDHTTGFGHLTERGFVRVWKKFQQDGRLAEAARILLADPLAAAKAYGLANTRCGICSRRLRVPSSIEAGIGPKCAERIA